jgi:uncharacterized protein involved in exopolysaccharide biosynthesis
MPNKEENLDLIALIKTGIKYSKHIITITLIGIVLGIIVSFIIKPKYEAFTVFYIPANNSISKSVLADNNLESFLSFGDEDQIDQVLEMLNSDNLKDEVINKFNLNQHYEISPDAKYPKTKVRNQFTKNTTFKRTDYLAIKIEVIDEDPQYSADMANYISTSLDSLRTVMQQGRAQQAFQIIGSQYYKKKNLVDSILLEQRKIRTQGIFDYEAQSEVLSGAIIKAQTEVKAEEARLKVFEKYQTRLPDSTIIRAKGRLAAAKATYQSLLPTVNTFGKLSGKYLELEALYKIENQVLGNLQLKYENAEVDFKSSTSQKYLIQRASVPEKNKYPNKTLVVILFALSSFLIAFLLACYLEFIALKLKS